MKTEFNQTKEFKVDEQDEVHKTNPPPKKKSNKLKVKDTEDDGVDNEKPC